MYKYYVENHENGDGIMGKFESYELALDSIPDDLDEVDPGIGHNPIKKFEDGTEIIKVITH